MTAQVDVQGTGPAAAPDGAVLTVDRLSVTTRRLSLLTDVSFALARGERVGLIGESGSGKSLTALALMGLLPEGLHAAGSVRLAGTDHDLVGAPEKRMSQVRGRRISMVFQEPMTALNPVMRVGAQVAEGMLLHRTQPSAAAARAAAVELLARVRLPDPASAARAYPHQLSGGQRQRVMLAMALANDPDVLVCDEPTTALDVTVQAQMLELVLEATVERDAGLLFITHDLPVVATVCQRLLVMYGGRIVESGTVEQVLTRPRHPYTQGLLAASDLELVDEAGRLRTIPGTVPAAGQFPGGCVFRNRCSRELDRCTTFPPWAEEHGHGFACWNPTEGQGARG